MFHQNIKVEKSVIKEEEADSAAHVIQFIKQEPEVDYELILSSAEEEEEEEEEEEHKRIEVIKVWRENPKNPASEKRQISFSDLKAATLPSKKAFQCSYCPQSFGTEMLLKFHESREHVVVAKKTSRNREKRAECKFCSKSFVNQTKANNHTERYHSLKSINNKADETKEKGKEVGDFSCKMRQCRKTFATTQELIRHVRWHEKLAYCNICGNQLSSKDSLDRHILVMHGPQEKVYRCSLCPKMFKLEFYVLRHMNTFHGEAGEGEFVCTICQKAFKLETSLKIHQSMGHKNCKQCEICGEEFQRRRDYKRHVRRHTIVKGLQCDLCPSRFERKTHIRRHVLKHRQFKCEICSKSFKIPSAFHDHLLKHFDRKPYKCDFCEKGFSDKYAIIEHIKADHLGQTLNIPCSICKKTFPTRVERNRHRQVHAKDKQTIKCENCNRLFQSGGGIRNHQKKCKKREEQAQFEMVIIKKEKM